MKANHVKPYPTPKPNKSLLGRAHGLSIVWACLSFTESLRCSCWFPLNHEKKGYQLQRNAPSRW